MVSERIQNAFSKGAATIAPIPHPSSLKKNLHFFFNVFARVLISLLYLRPDICVLNNTFFINSLNY